MEQCTKVIADWLIRHEAVAEEDRELYSYAVYSFILSLVPMLLGIGIGLLLNCVKQCIIFMIPFMMLRKYSGGYHAKNLQSCLVCSCLLLLLCAKLSLIMKCGWELLLLNVSSSLCLMIASPIDHENKKLSPEEKKLYKKKVCMLVLLFEILVLFSFLLDCYLYTTCISTGVFLSAGLQVPCIFKRAITWKKCQK